MRQAIREFARSGAPVYAECGGLMYLTEAIVGMDGRSHSMVGIFPTRVRMQPQLAAIGYVEVEELNGSGWLSSGERARGHEFRYSTIEEMPEQIARSYRLVSNRETRVEGF